MNEPAARIRATHLTLELFVVIAGILIAFSLDAWWSRRADQANEQAHLRALQSDFQSNVARLSELVEREEQIADASRRLLRVALTAGMTSAGDSLGNLLGQVFNSARFDPVMGAYEAVVSTGGLAQIRSDSLRLALADFASLLQGRYTERFADQLYFDFIRAFTGRLGIVGDVLAADSGAVARAGSAPAGSLLRDPVFREHLALRYSSERQVSATYQGLLDKASRILALVNAALR